MVNKKLAIVLGLAMLTSVSACSSSLRIEPGVRSSNQFCIDLGSILPVNIGGALVRSTNPDSPGTKAWGDPAIVLRCGVEEPASYSASSQLLVVGGVSWYPEELQAGIRFTSMQTLELVEVSIPNAYESVADILTALSSDVSLQTP